MRGTRPIRVPLASHEGMETLNTVQKDMLAIGTMVRTGTTVHAGVFGVIGATRKQTNTGEGWGEVEYRVDSAHPRLRGYSWVDENAVEAIGLAEVLAYYEDREVDLRSRINKLRDMVGRKLPKYNPEKHLGSMAQHLSDAYRHEDGSLTYICWDPEPYDTESPRDYDGNVATLIQTNSRCNDIDDDDAGLREAHERWEWVDDRGFFDYMPKPFDTPTNRVLAKYSREKLMARYLAMFRPDVLYYIERWSAGDSYGWGYVTREDWERWMGAGYDGTLTPEQAFDQEVKVYGQWANGEVYASCHVAKRGDEPDMVFGNLGYEKSEDIALNYTDSPILEVLA